MRQEKKTVVEQMLEGCAFAYGSHNYPLIFLDTEDMELAKRVALEGGLSGQLVPLVKRNLQADDENYDYYQYIESDPFGLDACDNFQEDVGRLKIYAETGELLDEKALPLAGGDVPYLFLVYVGEGSTSGLQTLHNILRKFVGRYIQNPDPQSLFRQSCVLLYGDVTQLSKDLLHHTAMVEESYPQVWELKELVRNQMKKAKIKNFEEETMYDRVAEELKGFSILQAERIIQSILRADEIEGKPLIYREERSRIIRNKKKEVLLQNGGILELVEQKTGGDAIWGMERYLAWVQDNKDRMENIQRHALTRGNRPPKGCLMCGVPGCGKSEAARLLGNTWAKLPLVKMNMDQLMGGLVGDSERNLRTALAQAEALAPMILWMDEVDKALAGASADNKHDSTFQRMFSRLLQWMQSNDKGCFVFATANDISKLPPEFMRTGRFDKLWAVYLPTQAQCIEIFKEQMRRAERRRRDVARVSGQEDPGNLFSRKDDSNCFADTTMKSIMARFGRGKFLTGSSIEAIVADALNRLDVDSVQGEVSAAQWMTAVEAAAEDTMTDISSPHSYHQAAANYIRLLRGNFVPVAENEELLFLPENYRVEPDGWDDIKVICDDQRPANAPKYDQSLFDTIKTIIDRRATAYEKLLQDQEFSAGIYR